ncbi:methyltransferase domain-containing protein [Patescibacteria group bacterium]|nr:methyltransferase domain-containing protein [Patescibacteria group bacterium]
MKTDNKEKYKYYNHEPAGLRKMKFIERILELEKNKKDKASLSILDVGCGLGHLSAFVASLGNEVKAIDVDSRSIATASEVYTKESTIFATEDLKDQTGEYDVVTAFEVCEHVTGVDVFLQEINQQIVDDGLLIVSVPNGYSLEEIIRRFLQHTGFGQKIKKFLRGSWVLPKSDSQSKADSSHIHFWGFGKWKKEIEKQGFVLENKKNVSFIFKQFYYIGGRRFLKPGKIFKFFDKLDNIFVSILPTFLADSWIMSFRKK